MLVESRFTTEGEADKLCPHGIGLAYSNKTIDTCNEKILKNQQNQKIISQAIDRYSGL